MSASWDERIMDAFVDHRTGPVTSVANVIMDAGRSHTVLAIGAMALLLLALWRRLYRPALAAAAAFVVATLAVDVLKPMFGRPRPPSDVALVLVDTPAFPSTHAATTSAIAVAVLLTMNWRTRRRAWVATVTLLTLVVLVGVIMVYLGAHWPSDVLAGWVLGGAIGGSIGRVARRSGPGRREPRPRAAEA